MLLHNLYRIAKIEKWYTDSTSHNRMQKNCPCISYPDLLYNNLNRSILEKVEHLKDDTIGTVIYTRRDALMPISQLSDDTVIVEPIYDYYKNFNIRIPSYLLHDLEVSGYNGIPARESVIYCKNDLTICHSLTELKYISALEIESSSNAEFPTLVTVAKGSTLDVGDGAEIRVNNHTLLVIDEGGTLAIRPGAKIILNGPEAVLHIKGDVELKNNVTFKILGGSNGKGYVLWESYYEDSGQTAHLIAGTNCKAEFTQNNTGVKALETKGNGGFETPWNLAELNIYDCTVLIGNDSRLTNHAHNGIFEQVAFRGNFGASANPAYDYKLTAMGGVPIR